MAEDLMAKLTGKQTGGGGKKKAYKIDLNVQGEDVIDVDDSLTDPPQGYTFTAPTSDTAGGRRHRRHSKGHKGNSWLAHVKATMKLHPGKSFKQILKIAKKTYKKSQSRSQSQSGGKKRQNQKNQKSQKKYQNGGSGGKMAGLGESAAPYV